MSTSDARVPAACQLFLERHWKKILDERLEAHLARHLLNLVDYGVINGRVVESCHQWLRDKQETYTRNAKQGHVNRAKQVSPLSSSPTNRSPTKGKRSPNSKRSPRRKTSPTPAYTYS